MIKSCEKCRVAKFACPRVLDDHKMNEDNQKFRSCCPPDYQISWEKYFENNCPYKFFKDFILTLSFSNKHISFWELTTNCKLSGFKMRTTIYMSRTTRFQILVVLRLPTFDSNFATLKCIRDKISKCFYLVDKTRIVFLKM